MISVYILMRMQEWSWMQIRIELLEKSISLLTKPIATLSETFITGILRNELGFTGFVMSDDFRMAGLRKQTSVKEGAVQFILAGGDLILCGANHAYQRQILEGLYEAVENGTIGEQRLNESVYRILTAKMRVTGWDPFENED